MLSHLLARLRGTKVQRGTRGLEDLSDTDERYAALNDASMIQPRG
jgi:hypothetical protein